MEEYFEIKTKCGDDEFNTTFSVTGDSLEFNREDPFVVTFGTVKIALSDEITSIVLHKSNGDLFKIYGN